VVNGIDDSEIKSLDDLKKALLSLTIPPTKTEDADFYSDYGNDTSYHTKTGKGECAA
jgi:sulfite reductase (ferredoxin)